MQHIAVEFPLTSPSPKGLMFCSLEVSCSKHIGWMTNRWKMNNEPAIRAKMSGDEPCPDLLSGGPVQALELTKWCCAIRHAVKATHADCLELLELLVAW